MLSASCHNAIDSSLLLNEFDDFRNSAVTKKYLWYNLTCIVAVNL